MIVLIEKYEVATIFKSFYTMIQNQFHTKNKVFQIENGKEYFNDILGPYLLENWIIHHSSCLDAPQPNRVVEEKKIDIYWKLLEPSNLPTMSLKFNWVMLSKPLLQDSKLQNSYPGFRNTLSRC